MPANLLINRVKYTLSRMRRHRALIECIDVGDMKPPFPDYTLYRCGIGDCKWKGWLHKPTVEAHLKSTGK